MATAQKTDHPIHKTQPTSGPDTSTAGTIVQTVKEQARDVMDSAADMAGQAKDKVQQFTSSMANQVKDTTQDLASAAAERAEDLGKDLTDMVRRYPIPALLVGFGIGLLLGRVSRI